MAARSFIDVHRGEFLGEEFLKPREITPYRLAKSTGLPTQRVNETVDERRGVSVETDLRLGAFCGQRPGCWLRVRMAYDLRGARHTSGPKIKATVRPLKAA